MLERDAELAQLHRCIQALRTAASCGVCVLLSGEAGGGKSSLLAQAARNAGADVEWLGGACEPLLSPQPLGPLLDLLDRLPPSLSAAVRAGQHTGEVMAGMLQMLRQSPRPAVLVIDDVQWADGATLDLLRFLGRRIASTHAILVLSFRDDGLPPEHPLRGVLGGLPPRQCLRLPLAPLTPAAVAEMARRAGRSAQGLHEATRGNPLYVAEWLASGSQALPASVRDAVLSRAAPLRAAARDLLDVASISPMPIELAVLASVVEDAPAALAPCTAAGLLVLDCGALRFRHELARRAVEASLPAGRAAALHAALFAALSVREAPLARLVHHAAGAGLASAVLALAPKAAHQAAQASAHRQAAALYALALAYAADLPLLEQAELHAAHALECNHLQRLDEAMLSWGAALALYRRLGNRLGEGRMLYEIAAIEKARQGPAAALVHADAAIALLEGLDAPLELAVAYAAKANIRLSDPTSPAAIDWARKALALIEGLPGAEECRALALNTIASARLRTEDAPEAWQMLAESRDIALAHGLDSHVAGPLLNLASLGLVHRRYAEVEAACEQGLAYCEAHDLDIYRMPFHVRRGHAMLETGRWDAAEALLATIKESPELSALDDNQTTLLRNLLDLRRGNDRSRPYWEALIAVDHDQNPGSLFAPNAVLCCEAAWLRGDTALVRRIANQAFALATRIAEGWRMGQLACWMRRAGGVPPTIALPIPAPCRLELAGDLRAAAQSWAALGCIHQQALVQLGGDEADLRQALMSLEKLGAAPAARLARLRLRALGVCDVPRGRNRRTRGDPLGLTAREREVLDLLARRLSNRDIAQHLHRSTRTVENHVAALLAKLGVRTRAEAAALGRAPPSRK